MNQEKVKLMTMDKKAVFRQDQLGGLTISIFFADSCYNTNLRFRSLRQNISACCIILKTCSPLLIFQKSI